MLFFREMIDKLLNDKWKAINTTKLEPETIDFLASQQPLKINI